MPGSAWLYWALPAYTRLYQAVLSSTKGQLCYTGLYQAHRTLLGSTKPYWALLGSTDLCRALLGSTGLYRPLLGSTDLYWGLPSFWALQTFAEPY